MKKIKSKSKSSIKKRFKIKKDGSVKRGRAKTSHLFLNKSNKQKRHLRKASLLHKSDYKRIKSMIKI